jgi:hypothetical protein
MGAQEQWFIGICRVGRAARGVCLDMLGHTLTSFAVTWSTEALRRFVDTARQAAQQSDIEVVVGLEQENLDDDPQLARALIQTGVHLLAVEQWMVEALWRSHKRRRQTTQFRAQCIAQILVISECPPRQLGKTVALGAAADGASVSLYNQYQDALS